MASLKYLHSLASLIHCPPARPHLHVPRRQPRHPLEDDRAQRPRVGEESGPLAADHHLGRLARVQEVALGQRVAEEEVLEVPQTEVGDLGRERRGLDEHVARLEVTVDDGLPVDTELNDHDSIQCSGYQRVN